MRLRFLLSHHPPAAHARCVNISGVDVCARCLGLYPVAALTFGALLAFGRAPAFSAEYALMLVAPTFLDWMLGQLGVWEGTNATRLLTGGCAGVGLAWALVEHLNHPYSQGFLWFIGILAAAAGAVLLRSAGSGTLPPEADESTRVLPPNDAGPCA